MTSIHLDFDHFLIPLTFPRDNRRIISSSPCDIVFIMIILSILGIVVYCINEIPKFTESLQQTLRTIHESYLNLLHYLFESVITLLWCKFFFPSCLNTLYSFHYIAFVLLTIAGGCAASTIPDKPNPSIPNKMLFVIFVFLFLLNISLSGCTLCSAIMLQNSIDLIFRGGSIIISQVLIRNLSDQLKKRSLAKLNEVLKRLHQPLQEEYDSPNCTALINEYSDRTHRKVYRYMRIIALGWHISVYVKCWVVYKEESFAMFVYLMKLLTNLLIEILTLHTMNKDEEAKLHMIHPLNGNEFEHLFEAEAAKSSTNEDTDLPCPRESCPICLSSQGVETVKLSSCGHMFHEGCILAMMRYHEEDINSKKCPICRTTFSK